MIVDMNELTSFKVIIWFWWAKSSCDPYYKYLRQACWKQIHHRQNFYCSADPPGVPDLYAPPIHGLQGGLRHHRPEWAMEHHAAVPFPWDVDPAVGNHHERGAVQGESIELDAGEATKRLNLTGVWGKATDSASTSHRQMSFEARGKTTTSLAWSSLISSISWLRGRHRNHRQDNSEGIGLRINATKRSTCLPDNQTNLEVVKVKKSCYLGTVVRGLDAEEHSELDGWIRWSKTCLRSGVYMNGRLQPGTEHPGEWLLTGPCHDARRGPCAHSWAGQQKREREREREKERERLPIIIMWK